MAIAVDKIPPKELVGIVLQHGWEMPSPKRRRIAPPPLYCNCEIEYLPEIHMVVPKGWRPPPLGEKCVCDECIRIVCSCNEVHDNPTPFQIQRCYVHGQKTLVGNLYRALHTLHNEEIAKEIAMSQDPTKEQEGL